MLLVFNLGVSPRKISTKCPTHFLLDEKRRMLKSCNFLFGKVGNSIILLEPAFVVFQKNEVERQKSVVRHRYIPA